MALESLTSGNIQLSDLIYEDADQYPLPMTKDDYERMQQELDHYRSTTNGFAFTCTSASIMLAGGKLQLSTQDWELIHHMEKFYRQRPDNCLFSAHMANMAVLGRKPDLSVIEWQHLDKHVSDGIEKQDWDSAAMRAAEVRILGREWKFSDDQWRAIVKRLEKHRCEERWDNFLRLGSDLALLSQKPPLTPAMWQHLREFFVGIRTKTITPIATSLSSCAEQLRLLRANYIRIHEGGIEIHLEAPQRSLQPFPKVKNFASSIS